MTEFKQGDKVKWKSHGGEATGHVERKITEETELAGRKVKVSKTNRNISSRARSQAARPSTSPRRWNEPSSVVPFGR